jgi:hypothetical protein
MSLPCEIPRRLRKNYRLHDQVTVSLDSSVTIDCCQDWIATRTAAFVAGLATPVTLGTATMAALGKAVVGGVGTGAALSVCENAPQKTEDQGAGGAPGAR